MLFSTPAWAQFSRQDKTLAMQYFAEAARCSANDREKLWGISLYGPMLFVDSQTRAMMANMPDTAGVLSKDSTIYTGQLPNTVNIANTAFRWGGRYWTMVLWPLPESKPERLNLMMHELFHRVQPELNFVSGSELNPHLDEQMGRTLLRLELKALQQALSGADSERPYHVRNALLFRQYRRQRFANSDFTEDNLERNEGLAEYTGLLLSGRTPDQMKTHLTEMLAKAQQTKSFVRSFAYLTGPAYGFMLNELQPNWHRGLPRTGSITNAAIWAYSWKVPSDLALAYQTAKQIYNGTAVEREENERAQARQQQLSRLNEKFSKANHLLIDLHKMSISFNPNTIVSLPEKGTVYATMRLTDIWGILDVTNEALVSSDWKSVIVSLPAGTDLSGPVIKTPDWTLTLTKPWSIQHKTDNVWGLMK